VTQRTPNPRPGAAWHVVGTRDGGDRLIFATLRDEATADAVRDSLAALGVEAVLTVERDQTPHRGAK
jgi:hypothetical protein